MHAASYKLDSNEDWVWRIITREQSYYVYNPATQSIECLIFNHMGLAEKLLSIPLRKSCEEKIPAQVNEIYQQDGEIKTGLLNGHRISEFEMDIRHYPNITEVQKEEINALYLNVSEALTNSYSSPPEALLPQTVDINQARQLLLPRELYHISNETALPHPLAERAVYVWGDNGIWHYATSCLHQITLGEFDPQEDNVVVSMLDSLDKTHWGKVTVTGGILHLMSHSYLKLTSMQQTELIAILQTDWPLSSAFGEEEQVLACLSVVNQTPLPREASFPEELKKAINDFREWLFPERLAEIMLSSVSLKKNTIPEHHTTVADVWMFVNYLVIGAARALGARGQIIIPSAPEHCQVSAECYPVATDLHHLVYSGLSEPAEALYYLILNYHTHGLAGLARDRVNELKQHLIAIFNPAEVANSDISLEAATDLLAATAARDNISQAEAKKKLDETSKSILTQILQQELFASIKELLCQLDLNLGESGQLSQDREQALFRVINSISDIKKTLGYLSIQQCAAVWQPLKDMLNNSLRYFSADWCTTICNALKDNLPDIITEWDFHVLLLPLSEKQCTAVCLAWKEKLPAIFKSGWDFIFLFCTLSIEQREVVYLALKDMLYGILKSVQDFNQLFQYLSGEQCSATIDMLNDNWPEIIKSEADFSMTHYFSSQQFNRFCYKLKNNLSAFICSASDVRAIFKHFSEEHCAIACQAWEDKLSSVIKSENDLKEIMFPYLSAERCTVIIQALKNKLCDIIKTDQVLLEILPLLSPALRILVCETWMVKWALSLRQDDASTTLSMLKNHLPPIIHQQLNGVKTCMDKLGEICSKSVSDEFVIDLIENKPLKVRYQFTRLINHIRQTKPQLYFSSSRKNTFNGLIDAILELDLTQLNLLNRGLEMGIVEEDVTKASIKDGLYLAIAPRFKKYYPAWVQNENDPGNYCK